MNQPYYLIERTDLGQPHWLAWRGRSEKAWVVNAHEADRYAWHVDAERDARGVRDNLPMFAQYIVVTEHLDVDAWRPDPARNEASGETTKNTEP